MKQAKKNGILQYRSSRLSDTGLVLVKNEDFAGFIEPVNQAMLAQSGNLYVVADGTGGTRLGERTSQYVVERVLTEYYQNPSLPVVERLVKVIDGVHAEIEDLAVESRSPMIRSMLIAAVIQENALTVASAGNCQAYHLRGESAYQITRMPDQAGSMGPAQWNGSNATVYHSPAVDIFENILLQPGDAILLCTDGMARYINETQVALLVQEAGPEHACRRLVDFANAAGGGDNITVLVIKVEAAQGNKEASIKPEARAARPDLSVKPLDVETSIQAGPSAVVLPADPISLERGPVSRRAQQTGRELIVLAGAVWMMAFICMVLVSLLITR